MDHLRAHALAIVTAIVLSLSLTPGVARAATPSPAAGAAPLAVASEGAAKASTVSWGPCGLVGTPVSTVYLPNITKTLGGASGWHTPFSIQNTGHTATQIEVSYYRFSDGTLVTCRTVAQVSPGQVVTDEPNDDPDLADDTQFSVVIRSKDAPVVATVDQLRGSGATTQAFSYAGFTTGATKVYLPNVTRRFYGYDVPFIVQNMGADTANVTVDFVSFDSTKLFSMTLTIQPGRSGVIDPDYTAGLVDGTQYAVTLTSTQPIGVVANADNEALGPVAYSTDGLASGGKTLYAPYASKYAQDGTFSPIVVQNVSASTTDATLTFTPLGSSGGAQQTFTLTNIPAGASRAFDPRFTLGTTIPCAAASSTCLGAGAYSLKITSTYDVAAVVLPNSATEAGAYVATPAPDKFSYLPTVKRNVGGAMGWNGTIYVQSAGATSAVVRFYRMPDYTIDATVAVTLNADGRTVAIEPATLAGLRDDTDYAVIVEGQGGNVVATLSEHADTGGDTLMMSEGAVVGQQPGLYVAGNVTNGVTLYGVGNVTVSAIVSGTVINRTSTDPLGNYVLPLATGSYLIVFDPPAGSGLVRQYSNGAYYQSAATPFVLGSTALVLNFALQPGIALSGRVTGPAGEPVAGATAVAIPSTCPDCANELAATTDAAGSYTVIVPAASYRMHVLPAAGQPYEDIWYPSSSTYLGASDINAAAPVANINVSLPRAYRVSGTVRDATGRPISSVNVAAFSGGTTACCSMVTSALTDLRGQYTLVVPAGTYRVMFAPPGKGGSATAWYGGSSFNTSADLVVVSDITMADTTLAAGIGFNGLTIFNALPVSATVEAYLGGNAGCCSLVYSGTSALDGSFNVGLAPGTYRFRFEYDRGGGVTYSKWLYGSTYAGATDFVLTTNPVTVIVSFP